MAESLKDKRILVLGMARQGKALGRWLPTQGAQVTISDMRDAGQLADDLLEFLMEPVSFALGGHPLELLDETDMLCISGGVPVSTPIVQAALEREIPVKNDAILFLERCPATIIGITGSAGKTTTTTLVGEMCKKQGLTTWVGGNTGHVLLDDLEDIQPDDIVVMELSSFQLEISTVSPDIAAVLNVTPNHLDRHGTMQAYAAAKANIFLHQRGSDVVILGYDDLVANSFEDLAPAGVAMFSAQKILPNGAFMVGSRIGIAGTASSDGEAKMICEKDDIPLRGEHNIMNVLAACAIAGEAGVEADAMRNAILEFKGVPHRLELVDELNGVQWINDSIATAPERVIAALKSFDKPIILLLGGKDKDLPWDDLAILATERCRGIITFGVHGKVIADKINAVRRGRLVPRLRSVDQVETLEQAVKLANQLAKRGDVVLLSPGCTSYDAYQDFAERGDHFRNLVNQLKQ